MMLSRSRALALLGSAALLPQCSRGNAIRIGSKDFTESFIIAEIYAQALSGAGLAVQRHLNLGSTQIAMAAMQRGDIDLYPEYTGTALIDVLHLAPISNPALLFRTVSVAFAQKYNLIWLNASPLNDSQGLATTRTIAARYRLQTLSQLAPLAKGLRLATIPEFVSRPDGLPGLQRVYGGFHFLSVRVFDIALKYQALMHGQADIATAFTTDGAIATDRLVLLQDDRHLWPPYNVAPVVRRTTLAREPRIRTILDPISAALTSAVAQRMNAAVESGNSDPRGVAAAFLKSIRH